MALRRQFIIYNRELVSPNALRIPCSFDPYDSKVPLDPETLIAEKIFLPSLESIRAWLIIAENFPQRTFVKASR